MVQDRCEEVLFLVWYKEVGGRVVGPIAMLPNTVNKWMSVEVHLDMVQVRLIDYSGKVY